MLLSCSWLFSPELLPLCDPDPDEGDAERLGGAGLEFVACAPPMFSEPEFRPEFAILPVLLGPDMAAGVTD
jgi:hypothetical protein